MRKHKEKQRVKEPKERVKLKDAIKSKKLMLMIVALVLVIIAIFIATNQEVRKNIIGALSGEIKNANENREIQVFDDGSAILTDDSAIVSSASIVKRTTGTGPFDENDKPGNDSSGDNNVVRSFDKVTWQIEANMEVNNTGHGSEDANTYNKFRGGIINIEATIPAENAGLMEWSLDDMVWTNGTGKVSEDGLTFTAQYKMSENKITIPGKQNLEVVLQVYGAGNGTELDPTFRLWMQGNESNKDNPDYEAIEIGDSGEKVIVSAKYGEYNINLKKSIDCQIKTDVDFGEGNVRGRMYGYGVAVELYGENGEKGLKGLAYEKGTVEFDINMKLEAEEIIDGKKVTTDITNQALPQLWNYKINIGKYGEEESYGNIPNRNMIFGGYTNIISMLPYGKKASYTNERNSAYNSGNISMEQQNNIIKTKITDYDFYGNFPDKNANGTVIFDNVATFSVGYFQIFVPDVDATLDKSKTYYLTVEDTNMNVTTTSNKQYIEQSNSSDDKSKTEHKVEIAKYNTNEYIYEDDKTKILNKTESGMGIVAKKQKIQSRIDISQNSKNDIGTEIQSMNIFIKFDGNGLEPILQKNGEKVDAVIDKITYKAWYATKKDGSNWVNQEERNEADIKDLNIYETLEEIPQGYICVGVYIEAQGKIEIKNSAYIYLRLMIKDNVNINGVYGIIFEEDYWREELDRSTQTITNPDATYPEPIFSKKSNYLNTIYDENGKKIGGHTSIYDGNSILVVGAGSSVKTSTINPETQELKTTYDLGKNENEVTFKVEPKLEELDEDNPAGVTGATVTIKDTLPKGLTYLPGSSNYGEPIEKIENEDGSVTLKFEKYNCNVGEEIEPLTFKATIDPRTANGTIYTNTAIIEPDREKIGLSEISFRTATSQITVVNLASQRLYKETDTPIIENNGEIRYKISYQTNNKTPDFQLLDVLPYNGDGRGTAYNGTYTLESVNIKQEGGSGVTDNSNIKLYTTTDIDARKISPKDEGIGIDNIWTEKQIGEEISETVTVIGVKGEIPANTTVEVEIVLKTSNNKAGDIYENSATAQTTKETEVITTANVETKVVKREIEGMIWYDTNENGIKDEEEGYANRIEVELVKADGSKAEDVNGNEIQNVLTDEQGKYAFTNLPKGEYKVKIKTEDKYKVTKENVGTNQEINSKFTETEGGEKESYKITNLNSLESPEIIEKNVNAGLVVKDAKIIVKYLEEDNTPETDEDNKVLKEQTEITGKKLEDTYEVTGEEIENYISLRNSGNTSGTLNEEETVVTYYYTYNKQNINIEKVWNDNNNQAGKRPTSIKVTLKDGKDTVKEQVITEENKKAGNENIWEATIEGVDIYRQNGEKIKYTVDEAENEGTLESYIKTVEGMKITNTFTQNTEKTQVEVTKKWEDNENKAGKRPENVVLILKKEVKVGEETQYQEVARQTINGTDNKGENENEWKYTFSNIAKYDENNDEIKYVVEEETPSFYETKILETAENVYEITNTFKVPEEKINVEVTKVWNDSNDRAGKRPESVTLKLSGDGKEYKTILTKDNKTVENENIWKATITELPKYDENANIISYTLSEENLNNIFYTEENTKVDQQSKTVTNRFEVPNDKISIEVNKKWEDNSNEKGKRPEEVTLYLAGNNQEYEITLNESNKKAEDENVWSGKIENLPKYDVNGNEITYTIDERPIASKFYTKTEVDQGSKTVTNKFGIPTESVQIAVRKIWEDKNNEKGKRPENIVLQIKKKGSQEVVAEEIVQGNKTTNEGWSYIFEVPKYDEEGNEVEYEIGEKDLDNKFYGKEAVKIDQEQKTITNVFTVPDEKVEIKVNKEWVDNEIQEARRPESLILQVKGENGEEVARQEVSEANKVEDNKDKWSYTFTNLPRYNEEGDEIQYTVDELEKVTGDLKFYKKEVTEVTNQEDANHKEATITNTFTKPEETTEITVNKVWKDNEIQSRRRPESIIIVVKNGEQEVKTQEISKENVVGGTTNQWSTVVEGLPMYNENGEEIQYTVDEREKNIGDLKFYEKEVTKVEDNQATIRNTFVRPEDKTEVTVSKKWEDKNNENNKRPEEIKLQVKDKDKVIKEQIVNEGNAKETDKNRWEYTFTDLEKYDENGEEIQYTADETEVNVGDLKFYEKGINGLEVTNTFKVPEEKINVTVNKEWVDNEIQETRRPESVVLVLKNPQGELARQEINATNQVQGNKDKWSYTFTNLPRYDEKGQEIKYTVEEQEKVEGDLHFYTSNVGNVENEMLNGEATGNKIATITNTFKRPEDTRSVKVTKIWEDNNNSAQKRPERIKIQLKNGNEVSKEEEITKENEVEGKTNEWEYTFEEVQKYDENGQEIVYTADETEVNSEDLKFYNKEIEGTKIINTFTQNTEKVNVTVTKKWEDNEIQEERRPESVILQVKGKNGEEVARQEVSEANKVGEDKDTWQFTFENLAKYDEENNIINYTVDEEEKEAGDLKFYTKQINGTTITNTFAKPKDTISIKVSKKWEDEENKYEKRPKTVELQVKNGGSIVKTANVGEDQNWEQIFTGLMKYDENGQEIRYTIDEGELQGEAQIYYTKEIEGTTITNRMTKLPGTVTVKYVDKNTKEEISTRTEKEGIVGESYDVTEDKKEIAGYTLIEEPEEKEGVYAEELQEKIYYYAKNTEVKVKYLEKDETEENTDNKVVGKEEIIEGYEGKEYTTEQKKIEGYTYIESKGKIEGTMGRETTEVIYYYSANAKVVVKYLEQDKTPGDDSDNKVLGTEEIEGYEGKEYTTEQKEFEGYTFVKATENTKGTMSKEEKEVIYYYAVNSKVKVKYLEEDKTPEDDRDNKVLETEEIEGYEGKEYKTSAKEISNYVLVGSKGETEGTMSKEEREVIYYYAQKTKVRVQHIDKETGEILKEEEKEGKVGDICKTEEQNIPGYILVEKPEKTEIEMTKEEQIVKYYYEKQIEGVIEKHIDIISGKVLEESTHIGIVGEKYKIEAKEFEGYDLVKEKIPENAEGEMTGEVIEVNYYYIKKASVKVEYLEKGTEKKLSEETIINGHENDNYSTEGKEIEGYVLVETPENAKGKMEVKTNEDGSYNTETQVKYYYVKEAGGVVEKHIDIDTGKILEEKTYTGKVGDKYEIEAKEFEGYDLVKEKIPGNAKGKMTEEKIEVIYYYEKLATVRVEYIDQYTGEKLKEERIEGHRGDKYETETKDFDGYDLVEIPSNSQGKMTDKEIVVKYYYQRKVEVEVQYLEKETGYVLKETKKIEGHEGDNYETKAEDIEYYKLIEQTDNTEGKMTKDKITVIYYYEKEEFNLKIETKISNVIIDGIPQIGQSYENKEELYKIDINRNKVLTTQVKVTYKIRVTNIGEIEGTASKITDLIPEGFIYKEEDNNIKWKEEDGTIVTDELKGDTIKPGESREIEIVLRWENGEENLGEKKNIVVISGITNPAKYSDMKKEDNSSKTQMLITIATGLDSKDRTVLLIAGMQILILIVTGVMFGRKEKGKTK